MEPRSSRHTKYAGFLRLFLVLCLAMPLFASCEDDNWRMAEHISGRWVSNDIPYSVFTLHFYRNGEGWVEERYMGSVHMYDEFYWDIDRDFIYVQYFSDGMYETWRYDYDRSGMLYVDGINGEYEIRFVRWY